MIVHAAIYCAHTVWQLGHYYVPEPKVIVYFNTQKTTHYWQDIKYIVVYLTSLTTEKKKTIVFKSAILCAQVGVLIM